MTPEDLQHLAQTYLYGDSVYVIVESLPQPYQDRFTSFLRGSAVPVGDGRNRYAFVYDFERWLAEAFGRSE